MKEHIRNTIEMQAARIKELELLLNSEQNDERNASQQKPNSSTTASNQIDSIRDPEFLKYVDETRRKFVNTSDDWWIRVGLERVVFEDMLIAYDQMRERLRVHNPSLRWVKVDANGNSRPNHSGNVIVRYRYNDNDYWECEYATNIEISHFFSVMKMQVEWLEESGESQ